MSAMRRGTQRIRKVEAAEEMAYAEHERWERDRRQRERQDAASAAGYRMTAFSDPFPPYVCPICGSAVTLSGTERHTAWHDGMSR